MIMAAGMGTRLKPWTLHHPKALVPIAGKPVLELLINRLVSFGFTKILINVHHFAEQVCEFISSKKWPVEILISDESEMLLDTGGALVHAAPMLEDAPVLIHNVDILSNCNLVDVMNSMQLDDDIILVTSGRESSRKLLFDANSMLAGWHNLSSGEYRPSGFQPDSSMTEEAFSGIYVINPKAIKNIGEYAQKEGKQKFPVMDYMLSLPGGVNIRRHSVPALRILDIGKPEALERARNFLGVNNS